MERDIDRYANTYLVDDFERVMVHYRRRKVLEFLEEEKPRSVLEVGCGADSLINHYHGFENFVIVEPSSKFGAIARRSPSFDARVELIGDFLENSLDRLREGQFDCIVASSLLHEVSEPPRLLETIRLLSGEKTKTHINVPNAESFHFLWAKESGLINAIEVRSERFHMLQQNTIFTMTSLLEMVKKAGFVVTEQGSYFVKPFNHAKMQTAMECGLIDDRLLDGLYGLSRHFPDAGAEIFVHCALAPR
ncbi:hypothetical protein FACS1894205_3480 [Alphaproteobacteria bacterium]|nr:hypothetical protein FACS1894205_3480 [Alphaproteobacteria bacterium]